SSPSGRSGSARSRRSKPSPQPLRPPHRWGEATLESGLLVGAHRRGKRTVTAAESLRCDDRVGETSGAQGTTVVVSQEGAAHDYQCVRSVLDRYRTVKFPHRWPDARYPPVRYGAGRAGAAGEDEPGHGPVVRLP